MYVGNDLILHLNKIKQILKENIFIVLKKKNWKPKSVDLL